MYNSKSKKRYLWKINVLVYLTIQNVNPCNINQLCYLLKLQAFPGPFLFPFIKKTAVFI